MRQSTLEQKQKKMLLSSRTIVALLIAASLIIQLILLQQVHSLEKQQSSPKKVPFGPPNNDNYNRDALTTKGKDHPTIAIATVCVDVGDSKAPDGQHNTAGEYMKITMNNHASYASAHEYAYKPLTELSPSLQHKDVRYHKLIWVEELLNTYNWVFFTDCDSLFMDFSVGLDLWTRSKEGSNTDLFLTGDHNYAMNSGQFLIRNTTWSREILKATMSESPIAGRCILGNEPLSHRCKCVGNDNAAFNYFLWKDCSKLPSGAKGDYTIYWNDIQKCKEKIKQSDHARKLGCAPFNTYPKYYELAKKRGPVFRLHVAGRQETKVSLLKQFLPLVNKSVNKHSDNFHGHDDMMSLSEQEKKRCKNTCCVEARSRTFRPYNPASNSDDTIPTIQDRVGIYELMESLPELIYTQGKSRVKNLSHTILTRDLIDCIQPGTIILVDTTELDSFFHDIYPLLVEKFVLFSMNGDPGAPGRFLNYLSDDLLLHWYASNCDASDDKLTCVPIGFAHNNDQKRIMDKVLSRIPVTYRYHGQPQFPKSVEDSRTELALATYNLYESASKADSKYLKVHHARTQVTEHLCGKNKDMWKNESIFCGSTGGRGREYLYEFSMMYKFMISPHGVGMDCYRTWEALFLGMAVVVKSSTLDPMYKDLPVLIVKDWSDLTPELLHQTWEQFQHEKFDFSSLYIHTWQHKVSSHRASPYVEYKYTLHEQHAVK